MSWQPLADIYRENADRKAAEAATPPEACPNDGTPLETGPRGELHCPHDGFIWTG